MPNILSWMFALDDKIPIYDNISSDNKFKKNITEMNIDGTYYSIYKPLNYNFQYKDYDEDSNICRISCCDIIVYKKYFYTVYGKIVKFDSSCTDYQFEKKINEIGIHSIVELDITCCKNILKVPYFPNLKKLNCSHTNIAIIPLMNTLESLNCNYCKNIYSIDSFPNLKEICCRGSNIINISSMEKLEVLDCACCQNMKSINYFPNLRALCCNYSPDIFSIVLMEKLEILYVHMCINLSEIPNFPNLKELNISGCLNMNKFPLLLKLDILNINRIVKLRICCQYIYVGGHRFFNSRGYLQGRLYQNTYRAYELLIF